MDKPKILILFYSMYGHIFAMTKAVAQGVKEAGGEPILKQAAELIPENKWDENIKKVKETMKDIPIADPNNDLKGIDGLILGVPTRYGNMTAQMRNFWDQTGADWLKGTLIGKPAAVFTGTSTQHGGQETTIISTMTMLLHHGCVLIGLPYSFKEQMTMDEITGGSPYGASTITGGMGERMPSENELKMAKGLGRHLTEIAKKLSS
ncbi:MAG: NAD(P)H:quinone oxidoreductase, type IV [Candidatus Portnoybacteria bacterium RIFCSPLOWO2_01_FULL_43_11]|uniref:NAD(P)H:quinone oxidoreductase, type IV n=3 Tax=Candidatus Portnoyibacteriota TaxID=1817913 RepID=A0A1G2F9X3_9BACT|nr:MAG: NAD(P)H:quinone oxidoreductase, type IV [Candidatus Portnoybacteria bacterium RIFCSPHIGHO2_01_FULL_40_12b]OGZ36852.1 MAG: NAD(P)H:quinone oxidoreductase, type IV [Candidatus Portnoybacteria bacterium RIFCSPHIGHO2_02_FULL_40_23]OGZ38240.1 MAG: NAD(P)H:quinone oxidoreductase, type IV [Candidatus Portnoybacteria bacterium RIFCSPLOWO2_01_FULL_43_11]OGZ39234.1 MAG: NAD(P)H:quinone oxidoreductase, type IV [Candidatus Portnoybacteria bacterium RIFCSPHIGHO2_12_FULL_40_11]